MKRYVFLLAISYFVSLIAACAIGLWPSVVAFFVLSAVAVIFLLSKKLRQNRLILISVLASVLAFAAFSIYTFVIVEPVLQLDGYDANISATLCELPEEGNGKYSYTLKTDSIDIEGAKQEIKLKISTNNPINIDIYDKLKAKVHFYKAHDDSDSFNTLNYQNSKGIYINAFMYEYENYEVLPADSKPLYYYAIRFRQRMMESINSLVPQREAALLNAVMLGQKQGLDIDIRDNMRIAGVSHLVSVSGLHLAILGQFLMSMFLFLGVSKKFSAGFTAALIFIFMALTGFVPSVMRAGIMALLFYIGILFERESEPLTSLGIAVLIMCIANPLAGGDIGLILSFFATLGLLLFSSKFKYVLQRKSAVLRHKNKFLDRFISTVNTTIATTLSATVFTLPFTMTAFSEISLVSILGNLFMVYPASFMMLLAMLSALVCSLGLFALAVPFAFCAYLFAKYTIFISWAISSIPFASISTSEGFVSIWLASTLFLAAFLFVSSKRKYFIRVVSIYAAIVLLFGITTYQVLNHAWAEVSILSCGNNMAVSVKNNGYTSVLSCGGSSSTSTKFVSYLKSHHINSIDTLMVADSKPESAASAGSLLSEYRPNYILLNEKLKQDESVMTAIGSYENNNGLSYFKDNMFFKLTDAIKVDVFEADGKSFESANINGFKFLFCPSGGDAKNLSYEQRQCDFFVMSEVPANVEKIQAEYTVLAMSETTAAKTIKYGQLPKTQNILKTSEGDLSLKLKPDRSVKIAVST